MDFTQISDLITNIGFPIVCVGALFWVLYQYQIKTAKDIEQMTKEIIENRNKIEDISSKLDTNAIVLKNSEEIQKILDKLNSTKGSE